MSKEVIVTGDLRLMKLSIKYMVRNLNSTLFILICSNALYNTLRDTLARLHWAVYDFVRNFAGTQM